MLYCCPCRVCIRALFDFNAFKGLDSELIVLMTVLMCRRHIFSFTKLTMAITFLINVYTLSEL